MLQITVCLVFIKLFIYLRNNSLFIYFNSGNLKVTVYKKKGISKVPDDGSVILNLDSSPESLEKRGHWPVTARKGQNDQMSQS